MEFMSVLVVLSAALMSMTSAQPNLCPANFGDFQDGNSCVTFLRCRNGIAYRFNCPRQFPFFDAQNRRCINQRTINCVQNNNFQAPLVPGRGFGVGQAQQPGINQVQIAGQGGQPGVVPNNGILGQPNLSAPILPSNPPGGVLPGGRGRGGQIPVLGGVPLVGVGANAGAAATGNGNAGAQAGGNVLAGAGAGGGAGGATLGAQVGTQAGAGLGQPQGTAGAIVNNNNNPPFVVPARQGVLAPPQPGFGNQGPAFLNNPQGQGQGNVNAGNNGTGQGQGQGFLAGIPFVNVNQRQSATVNQNQSVGVNPGKK